MNKYINDVKEVRHGKWITDNNQTRCSICGNPIPIRKLIYRGEVVWENNSFIQHCPNCGAEMDLEGEGEKEMKPVITSNSCDLGYVATNAWGVTDAHNEFIKTYSEPEGVRKAEEPPKKEPIIDHKFLETFEWIMKKDIAMREKATQLVDKVMVHGPALIVFWKDKSKTVVKCANEEFDLEKGIAMAFIKRMFGNKGNYNALLNFIISSWTY